MVNQFGIPLPHIRFKRIRQIFAGNLRSAIIIVWFAMNSDQLWRSWKRVSLITLTSLYVDSNPKVQIDLDIKGVG